MKVRFHLDDAVLIHKINVAYDLEVTKITFIPIGDSAYSYTVNCSSGERFYVKLFDTRNDKQLQSVQALDDYLPLTWSLYHKSLFTRLTYPLKNRNGSFTTRLNGNGAVLVLFNFIEGGTLAEAYPFSESIIGDIAASLAEIHYKVTPKIQAEVYRKESFDISFIPELCNNLTVLEYGEIPIDQDQSNAWLDRSGLNHTKALQALLLPRKDEILSLTGLLQELSKAVSAGPGTKEFVLCHGDVWGGNLIYNDQGLIFLDWESCILAPPERDLFGYLGQPFEWLYKHYIQHAGRTAVTLNSDLLRFYSYRTHLRNLTNWMTNMLYRNTEEEQNLNDLEMIEFHCIGRWEGIEAGIQSAEAVMKTINPL